MENKTNTLEGLKQFKGQGNPFDVLWYISIEVGRGLMFRTHRIGTGIGDGVDSLLERYAEISEAISKLTEEERHFLLEDSYYGKTNFVNVENTQLMDMAALSASEMSSMVAMSSKEYLIATMGEQEGTEEFIRRQELAKIAYGINDIGLLWKALDNYGDKRKEFFKDFTDKELSDDDIHVMISIVETGTEIYN